MPIERRHIVFRPSEYIDALRAYRRRCGKALPGERLLRSGLVGEEAPQIELSLATRQGGEAQVAVPAHEIVAALVFHCVNNRIPLPSKAPKGLKRYGDSLAITLELEL